MIKHTVFGKTSNEKTVYLYTISNEFLTAKISTLGAALVSLIVKSGNGRTYDIVLGYDDVLAYEYQNSYMGCVVGRCCNRIAGGIFKLNGKTYHLSQNEGSNHLHGGFSGFDKKLWAATIIDNYSLKLTYLSKDGEENYPGKLTTSVIYSLRENNLYIDYSATSSEDTICNLTNHTYFNLNGYDSGNILEQEIQILADKFTEDNAQFLPTGKILSVDNTPMDLREPIPIGKYIHSNFSQIEQANGYNTNYLIKDKLDDTIVHFATAYSPISNIILKAYTNMPCVEYYTGSYLTGSYIGKNNAPIKNYYGFALEPQFAPNAINLNGLDKPVLLKGNIYQSRTIFEIIS